MGVGCTFYTFALFPERKGWKTVFYEEFISFQHLIHGTPPISRKWTLPLSHWHWFDIYLLFSYRSASLREEPIWKTQRIFSLGNERKFSPYSKRLNSGSPHHIFYAEIFPTRQNCQVIKSSFNFVITKMFQESLVPLGDSLPHLSTLWPPSMTIQTKSLSRHQHHFSLIKANLYCTKLC